PVPADGGGVERRLRWRHLRRGPWWHRPARFRDRRLHAARGAWRDGPQRPGAQRPAHRSRHPRRNSVRIGEPAAWPATLANHRPADLRARRAPWHHDSATLGARQPDSTGRGHPDRRRDRAGSGQGHPGPHGSISAGRHLMASYRESLVVRVDCDPVALVWSGLGFLDLPPDAVIPAPGERALGGGELISVPDFQQLIGGTAERLDLTFSGVDEETVRLALEDAPSVRGARVDIGTVQFDGDWQILAVEWENVFEARSLSVSRPQASGDQITR